jgi:hypothetical protein
MPPPSHELPGDGCLPLAASPRAFDLSRWAWTSTIGRAGALALACWWLLPRLIRDLPPARAAQAAFGLFLTLVFARWAAGLPDAATRARAARDAGAGRFGVAAAFVVPVELVGLLRLARLMAIGTVSWLARKPPPPRPEGIALSDRRSGFYDALFSLNVVSFAVEVPLMLAFMHAVAIPFALQCSVHLAEIAAIALVLGDRWHVLAGGHVLTQTHLDLMAGARAAARIPLSAIESIEPINRRRGLSAWRRTHGVHPTQAGIVSVLDTPSVALKLRHEQGATWSRFQSDRPLPRYLLVYVDEPSALADAVSRMRRTKTKDVDDVGKSGTSFLRTEATGEAGVPVRDGAVPWGKPAALP